MTTTPRLKPAQSSSIVSSSDHRPTVVLCSSKDDHLLSQDICTLCGSLGKADEGNLISCSQCGQCYHPYCVNIKGLKVVVSKGWRCLECTVCETCGQPGDEAKLLLCDECELSCHTYCLNPPLEEVPQDAWKCNWCVVCQRCGSHASGVNSDWQKNYTECGPCSSLSTCPKCKTDYNQDELIIQCLHCSRWLHAHCDSIKNEEECELASELGYTCLLCRPKDEMPMYIVHRNTNQQLLGPTQNEPTQEAANAITNNTTADTAIITNPTTTTTTTTTTTIFGPTNNPRETSSNHFYPKLNDHSGYQKSHLTSNNVSGNNNELELDFARVSNSCLLTKLQSDFPRPRSAPLTSANEINILDPVKRPSSSQHFSSNDLAKQSELAEGAKTPTNSATILNSGLKNLDSNLDSTAAGKLPAEQLIGDLFEGLHMVDGVYLSQEGFNFIKSKKIEPPKRQRTKRSAKLQKLDEIPLEDRDDDEENKLLNEDKADEDGRRKRVRKLSKVGIGGFSVRQRGVRIQKEDDFSYSLGSDGTEVQFTPSIQTPSQQESASSVRLGGETLLKPNEVVKPKRIRKKPKKKADLINQYPSYLQEAFFGKDLLTGDEIKASEEKYIEITNDCSNNDLQIENNNYSKTLEVDSNNVSTTMNDSNTLPTDLNSVDDETELMNKLLDENNKAPDVKLLAREGDLLDVFPDETITGDSSEARKDAFDPDLLTTDFDLNMVAQIDSKVVEDVLNGLGNNPNNPKPNLVTQAPETFEQQSSSSRDLAVPNQIYPTNSNPQQQSIHHNIQQQPPLPPPPIPNVTSQPTIHHIQQQTSTQMISPSVSSQNWESEEALGSKATKSAVLYANLEHPNLRQEFRTPDERFKQIQKLWRQLPSEKRKPYVDWARENRSASKVSNKPGNDTVGIVKKAGPQHIPIQQKNHSSHEMMHMQHQSHQPSHMNQIGPMHQPQDIRWKQPIPLEGQHQQTRFLPSPLPHRPSPSIHDPSMACQAPPEVISPSLRAIPQDPNAHYEPMGQPMAPPQTFSPHPQFTKPPPQTHRPSPSIHDPNMPCQPPPEVISPSLRAIPQDTNAHYEPMGQPMAPPQTFSPHPQFIRPPSQPHSMIQVSRVRPPTMQNSDPYATPPSTPRPVPMQQRSPFSPQSPFSVHPASSTPPIGPRTPNEQQVIYRSNQHYYGPNVGGKPHIRNPVNPQMCPQQQQLQQQPHFQQQQQYRQPQPIRYPNQQQEIHQQMAPSMQQTSQIPQIQHQRMQNSVVIRQLSQPVHMHQQPVIVGQNRIQHQQPMVNHFGGVASDGNQPVHQMQQQRHSSQQITQQTQQVPFAPMHQQHAPHQQQHQHQLPQQVQQPQHVQQQQQSQPQPHPQQQPQQPQQPQPQPQPQQQQTTFNGMPPRLDTDETAQLLEDEDDLKDLGADFNILEYADPEPDISASTSAGKNNIELDAELEDYFGERDTIDDRRVNDQTLVINSNQQTSQQIVYNTPHQSNITQQAMPNQQNLHVQNQNFGDRPSVGAQQSVNMQPTQFPAQRPQHFTNQQRIPAPQHQQQYVPQQQQQTIRLQQPVNQMRMPHPQQHSNYQQPTQRYQSPNHEFHHHQMNNHSIHQQGVLTHQPQANNSLPTQRSPMQTNPQYGSPRYIDNQQVQPQQEKQPQQYATQQQQQQQQHVMYVNHQQHPQQYNPRRQFVHQQQQQQQQPQQQPQVHYTYQNQNPNYQQNQMNINPQHHMQQQQGQQQMPHQQHLMKSNDMMIHEKSPIIGDTITSMEFSMYEQGSGANNEAINLPMQTNDSSTMDNTTQDETSMENSDNSSIQRDERPEQPLNTDIPASLGTVTEEPPRFNHQSNVTVSEVKQNQIVAEPSNTSTNFKFATISKAPAELSKESKNQIVGASQTTSIPEKVTTNSHQPQNQLLKQLLGNCSSADSPNQESSPSLLVDNNKIVIPPTTHSILTKSNNNSGGIPNISFQLGPNKSQNPTTVMDQSNIKPPNIIASTLQTNARMQSSMGMNNFESKTYNVGQQVQPVVNLNIAPMTVRIQQLPPQLNSIPVVQKRPNAQIVCRVEPSSTKSNTQELLSSENRPPAPDIATIKKIKSQPEEEVTFGPRVYSGTSTSALQQNIDNESDSQNRAMTSVKPSPVKRKNDYIAERRAALEKEKTPPPREIKPKKRVRGPNKQHRITSDGNDEVRVNDSNSNTSETSQQPELQPPRKRVRKSQIKIRQDECPDNMDTILSTVALKMQYELPAIPVQEPNIRINNNINSIFACGDLNSNNSNLKGRFGRATTKMENAGIQTKRQRSVGYYHEEFPSSLEISLNATYANGCNTVKSFTRDCDSPDSVVFESASENDFSPDIEMIERDISRDSQNYEKLFTPDLDKLSKESTLNNIRQQSLSANNQVRGQPDMNNNARAMSPSIPTHIRLPTKQIPASLLAQEADENDKENFNDEINNERDQQFGPVTPPDQQQNCTSLNMRLKDHGNVSVTLTLTNKEADGVKRVLSSLSQLIDYPIQSSCVTLLSHNVELERDDCSNLSNSFRLLTGSSQNQFPSLGHKNLKFNEQNYVAGASCSSILVKTEPVDIKPELCCRCNAVVMDHGIRKDIKELPKETIESMQKSSITTYDKLSCELVFCSVNCYASSVMTSTCSTSVTAVKRLLLKDPTGLPPMSPMMEEDEEGDEHRQQLELQESDKLRLVGPEFDGRKRKWAHIRYTRWTPSHFSSNKYTSPPATDDLKEVPQIEGGNLQYSAPISNNADSSIDSNESDTSTCYSQPIEGSGRSGKLGIMDDPFETNNQEAPRSNQNMTTSLPVVKNSRPLSKDKIIPWPEGMDYVQVRVASKNFIQNNGESIPPLVNQYELEDTRRCVLCHGVGDGDSDGPARLLNLYIDGWVHLNCALWSLDVYELANGALMNVDLACKKAMTCSFCHKPGATLKCFKPRCLTYYHFLCATKEQCSFYEDKSVQCKEHSKSDVKELASFVVKRRVYVNRDEQKQIAEMIQGEQQNVMRIGSLVFLNIGQLLPHQLTAFHDQNSIFPVGYKIVRYYWSFRRFNKRCKYLCTIHDNDGRPQFKIVAQEHGYEDQEFCADSPQAAWRPIIEMMVELRKQVPDTITIFPAYIRGEDLFGLTEPSVVRILESLPGVGALTDYEFKFGRSPLLELPLAINPTGCARTEPKLRTHFKRPCTIHTASSSVPKSRLQPLTSGDSSSPYIKQFVHSKSSQYRKMKSEWRNNVVLARSRVQGLGLYAARDIEKHTMVIEYIGMLIRNEIAERYERIHEAHNRGIYMFRLDEDRVIDATLAGGLARYINHSCNPNCVAEAVEIDRERKILIIANRKILKGEELGYDYKLAIEDDQHKISCLCGAASCKKWMN